MLRCNQEAINIAGVMRRARSGGDMPKSWEPGRALWIGCGRRGFWSLTAIPAGGAPASPACLGSLMAGVHCHADSAAMQSGGELRGLSGGQVNRQTGESRRIGPALNSICGLPIVRRSG